MPNKENEKIELEFIEEMAKIDDEISQLNAKMEILKEDEDFILALSASIPETPEKAPMSDSEIEARTLGPSNPIMSDKDRAKQVASIEARTFEPSGTPEHLEAERDERTKKFLAMVKKNPEFLDALRNLMEELPNMDDKTKSKKEAE